VKLAIRPLAPCGPGCAHAATPADPPAPCDLAFVAASWSGAWHQPPEASLVTTVAWRAAVWASVPAIVARPDVRVLVAADGDAADHVADLFGWLAWSERPGTAPAVLFCYVKSAYRFDPHTRTGPGIARRLFERARIDPRAAFAYVCLTGHARRLRDAGKLPHAKWRPDLGRPAHERTPHGQPRPDRTA
jgi:hypothetical protein